MDAQQGNTRKRTGFSLFSRQKSTAAATASAPLPAISAPVILSPTTGAAANIPGFVAPERKAIHSEASTVEAGQSTSLGGKERFHADRLERAAQWAAKHSEPPAQQLGASTAADIADTAQPASVRFKLIHAGAGAGTGTGADGTRKSLLLPTSFSTGSGLTTSSSHQCISASTSHNTELPALHPILNTSASGKDLRTSTYLAPSASGGGTGMPSLASAIKLGAGAEAGTGTGVPVIHTRTDRAVSGPSPIMRSNIPNQSSTLPRSFSGSSVFTIHRAPTSKALSKEASGGGDGGGGGSCGESFSRRISRRLSIDGFRPKLGGASHKRRSVLEANKGVSEFGAKIADQEIKKRDEPSQPAPPAQPAAAKDKMMLPGIRSWRTRFKSQPASDAPGSSAAKSRPPSRSGSRAGGSDVQGSVSRGKRDSWADIGSMRSRMARFSPAAVGPRELDGVSRSDERKRPVGSAAMQQRVFTIGSEHENVCESYIRSPSAFSGREPRS